MREHAATPPARVLLVHNAYQQRGGEDAVVEAEAALLREHGHEVMLYTRHNDEVQGASRLALARDTLWSPRTGRDLQALISQHRPDVVHVHNSFPLVSPSVYWAAARAGLPVVQTLHNFRLLCPQALLLREGRLCEDCVGRVPWRAVQHGCYRGSAVQSAAVAGMLQLHRGLGTWQRKVTLYIALNAFCRDKFIEGGLPGERIRIKPNFVDLPAPAPHPREGFLFVGRFSLEKGLAVLAQALALAPPGTAVHAAGSGPDAPLLEGAPGVHPLGPLPPAAVYAQMARRRALVLPSIWYENFPRTLVEAFANGLPVIASRLGAMATLVEDGVTGLLFQPGDAADLAAKLAWADAHPAEMQRMGDRARRHYEAELTGPANLRQLQAIYSEALALHGAAWPAPGKP
jgi:glycosyltransferase involved in cell wall biosynthesis